MSVNRQSKFGFSVLVVALAVVWLFEAAANGNPSTHVQSVTSPAFGPMSFTTEFDARNMRPVGSQRAFDVVVSHFYAYAACQGAPVGTQVKAHGYFTLPFVGQEVLFYENESAVQSPDGLW
jgi:hypothetical protein